MKTEKKPVADTTKGETVQKIGKADAAPWQMDVVEFNRNGCLINGN